MAANPDIAVIIIYIGFFKQYLLPVAVISAGF